MPVNMTELRMWQWIQGGIRATIDEEIRKEATVQPMTTHLMKKRLRWCGHVRRRYDNHNVTDMIRPVLAMEVEGVRPGGTPTLRYMHTIRIDIKTNDLTTRNGEWQ